MTEDQAKTKWCPFARQVVSIQHADGSHIAIGSANRSEGGMLGMCVGSQCMAWRKRPTGDVGGMRIGSKGEILELGRPAMGGFCGLAGRPE